jgi:glyoxylase-like metal-dependent hydrolase (beta-lactamase superfamily II)
VKLKRLVEKAAPAAGSSTGWRRQMLSRRVLPIAMFVLLASGVFPLAAQAQAPAPAQAAAPRGPAREIIQIAPDLYRARNGNWYTIFLVTPRGIILADPINLEFARWLRMQLDERFKTPVRYVVYSHSHYDHASGGEVFADTATFVAHENMLRNMDGRYPHMPGDMYDRNDNGHIDPEEISIPTNAAPGICGLGRNSFAQMDRNGDGRIPPQELQADIRRPDIVYSGSMRIVLGGKTVDIIHPGLNHSDDASVMYFPAERVVFATEFLADALVTTSMRSLPSACGAFDGSPMSEWIRSYRTVEALDFDVLAPGHGNLFRKADVVEARVFFEDLRNEVSAGMAAGKTLKELQDAITLSKYKDWAYYDRLRASNVAAAYQNLKLYR